jgi:hercynine metabolism protein
MSASWFDELTRELERQLEVFLDDHPSQRELLEREEEAEAQRRRQRRLLEIAAAADRERQRLLSLSGEIRQWRERVDRARSAGATDLAVRAEEHLGRLMGQGREAWQALAALGEEDARLRAELNRREAPPEPAPVGAGDQLEQDWAAFEADQELQELRRRQAP